MNEQGFDARLGRVRGTLRFEVDDGSRVDVWRVLLDRGSIEVSEEDGPADCEIRLARVTLDGMVEGSTNATAAFLRGLIGATGNFDLLVYLQRLFPAGSGARDRRPAAASGGQHG